MSLELKDLEHLVKHADFLSPALRKPTDDEKTTWIENKDLSTDKVIVYNKFNNNRYLLIYCPLYEYAQVYQLIDKLTDLSGRGLDKRYPITDQQMDLLFREYQYKLIETIEELNETKRSYIKLGSFCTPTLFVYVHPHKKFGKIFMNNYTLEEAKKIFNRFLERKQLKVCKPIYEMIEKLKKNE